MSVVTRFCQCKRRETRKVAEARHNGYFCPTCFKQLDPIALPDPPTPKKRSRIKSPKPARQEYTEEEILNPDILDQKKATRKLFQEKNRGPEQVRTRSICTAPESSTGVTGVKREPLERSQIETSTPRFTPPELSEADQNEGRSTVVSNARAECPGGLPPPQLDDTKDFDTDEFDTETDPDYDAIPTSVKGDYENFHEALARLREYTPTKTTEPIVHLQRTTTTRTEKSGDKRSGTPPGRIHSTPAGVHTPTKTASPGKAQHTGIVDKEPTCGTSAPRLKHPVSELRTNK